MEDIFLSKMEIERIESYYNKILTDVDINKFNEQQKLEKYPTKFMIEEFYVALKQIIDYYDSKIKDKTEYYLKNKNIVDGLLEEINLFLKSDHTFVPDDYLSSWVRTIIRFRELQKEMVEFNNKTQDYDNIKDEIVLEQNPPEEEIKYNSLENDKVKRVEETLNKGLSGLNMTSKQRRIIDSYLKDPYRGVVELSKELGVSASTVSSTLNKIRGKINPLINSDSRIKIEE